MPLFSEYGFTDWAKESLIKFGWYTYWSFPDLGFVKGVFTAVKGHLGVRFQITGFHGRCRRNNFKNAGRREFAHDARVACLAVPVKSGHGQNPTGGGVHHHDAR